MEGREGGREGEFVPRERADRQAAAAPTAATDSYDEYDTQTGSHIKRTRVGRQVCLD